MQEIFFPELHAFQRKALRSLRKNSHTILTAPTGSGKSLVFQKYLYESKDNARAVLISPLNALSRQIAQGLKDLHLNVKLGIGRSGEKPPTGSGIWIVSPEKLMGRGYDDLTGWHPNVLIVDEAHCIWEWGQNFRPAFSKLPTLVEQLKIAKSFWCSATFPSQARSLIVENLPKPPVQIGKFSLPPTLKLERLQIPAHLKLFRLRTILEQSADESGMIFVSSRAAAERLRTYLMHWGFDSIFYHAGLSPEERVIIEKKLGMHRPDHRVWIVATSAFGMGMNYPFLKTCILFDPSLTLLSLAQSLGRVGRSGASANAYIFWNENDFRSLEATVGLNTDQKSRSREVQAWCATSDCPRAHLEKYFNGEQN